jgi:hypothetical protein
MMTLQPHRYKVNSPSKKMGEHMVNIIPDGVKWGAIGLFAGTAMLLPTMLWARDGDSALWFVALLVLMTAALTLTAMVFNGLSLTDAGEAFGLPSGSVRTLLAVGVMVLFAVFGLKFFAGAVSHDAVPRLSDKPIEQVEVPAARLQDEVARYEKSKFLVVVTAPGRAASANGRDDPGVNAKLSLYTLELRRSPEAIDVQKQMLTAIITLLTTVIGFYFGSKSAGEGLRGRAGNPPPADPAGLGPQRDALKSESEAVDAAIAAQRQTLAELQALPRSGDVDRAKDIADVLSKALDVDGGVDALRDALATALAAVQDKTAAVATAAEGNERSAREGEAQDALTQARVALDALDQASKRLATLLADLQTLTAVG